MKIGLCGGTFDPLHNGHFDLVRTALLRGGLDQVIVMPAGRPPHKRQPVVSMAGYRYEMASQAFAGQSHIQVSDLEIRRPGRSFTLDTIRQLQSGLSADSELFLVYGSDILQDIEHWHEPAAILAACPLLLARRGGSDQRENLARADYLRRQYGGRIDFFDGPDLDLSGTQIRQAIQAGQPYRQWVPESVAQVIRKNGLYRYQDELSELDPELWQRFFELERQLWPVLNRKRLLHS
jgi:nicotinate-nucleotide adenylyltransferase